MTTLHITRGIPSSGKTTWAKKWVSEDPDTRIRVNRDDLRMMSFGRAGRLTHEQESMITSMSRMSVKNALTNGIDVVVDDMHLRPKYIQEWVNLCSALDADWEIHEFPITVEEAIGRDQGVDRPEAYRVGERLLRSSTPMAGSFRSHLRRRILLPIVRSSTMELRTNLMQSL